jgi:hypothetical protein
VSDFPLVRFQEEILSLSMFCPNPMRLEARFQSLLGKNLLLRPNAVPQLRYISFVVF